VAIQNIEKAIAQGGLIGDPNLDQYKEHLKRVQVAKAVVDKAGTK